jgi:hypothetical protein
MEAGSPLSLYFYQDVHALKKTSLRLLGLTAVFVLTVLTTASAAPYDCTIQCLDGTHWQGTTATYQECCAQFGAMCNSYGQATWERPTGLRFPCPSAAYPGW